MSGNIRIFAGQPDVAIEHLETALRLSPLERFGSPLTTIGAAYKRQFNEAVSRLLLAIQDSPGFPTPYRLLASCYAHMGHLDEARAIIARCGPSPGTAAGNGQGDMSHTRRLAAILAPMSWAIRG
jgi:adenylate cyclase